MPDIDPRIHFRILEDIARDLSGDVNFPTCLDAAVIIRDTLRNPMVGLERVIQVVSIEPLISSKLLRLANSVIYNPSGKRISNLTTAISFLGFETVRTTSLAVAMDQMLKSRSLAVTYKEIARSAWRHSLRVAAIARVLARRIGRVAPDEAMLAGLVQDIGIFYLLFRAAEYDDYRNNQEAVLDLIRGWHASIGESLLHLLDLPEHITEAIRNRDWPQNIEMPSSLRDILYFANALARDAGDALPTRPEPAGEAAVDRERFADLLDEANEDIAELQAVLSA